MVGEEKEIGSVNTVIHRMIGHGMHQFNVGEVYNTVIGQNYEAVLAGLKKFDGYPHDVSVQRLLQRDVPYGVYCHYKEVESAKRLYTVVGHSIDESNGWPLVQYRGHDGRIWSRRVFDFTAEVQVKDGVLKRFMLLQAEKSPVEKVEQEIQDSYNEWKQRMTESEVFEVNGDMQFKFILSTKLAFAASLGVISSKDYKTYLEIIGNWRV